MINDSQRFLEKFKFYEEPFTPDKLRFRNQLLSEEYTETMAAYDNKDPEEFVDGLIDVIVIAMGTLLLAGVDVDKAWAEVMRANLSKERGIKPGREQSDGYDVIKPEGWVAPSHQDNHGKLDVIFSQKN